MKLQILKIYMLIISLISLITLTGCVASSTAEFEQLKRTSPEVAQNLGNLEYLVKINIDPKSQEFKNFLANFMLEMGGTKTIVVYPTDAERCFKILPKQSQYVKVTTKDPSIYLHEYSKCINKPITKQSVGVIVVDKNIHYIKTVAITNSLYLDDKWWVNFLILNAGIVFDEENVYFFADIYKTIGDMTYFPSTEMRRDMVKISTGFFEKNKISYNILKEDMKPNQKPPFLKSLLNIQ